MFQSLQTPVNFTAISRRTVCRRHLHNSINYSWLKFLIIRNDSSRKTSKERTGEGERSRSVSSTERDESIYFIVKSVLNIVNRFTREVQVSARIIPTAVELERWILKSLSQDRSALAEQVSKAHIQSILGRKQERKVAHKALSAIASRK